MLEQLTLWSEEAPVSPSLLLETGNPYKENHGSCSSTFELFVRSVQDTCSGRMSQVACPRKDKRARKGALSDSCSQNFANAGMACHGEFWTRNSSEWHNDADVSFLSDVLETQDVPQKYFLSPKACAGIIRRAETRGKALPSMLKAALEAVIRCSSDADAQGGGKGALIQEDVSATLSTSNVQTVFQPIEPECYCLQGNMIGRGDKNGPQGDGINEDVAYTLNTTDRHAVAYLPFDKTQVTSKQNGSNPQWGDPCHTISSEGKPPHVVCMSEYGNDRSCADDLSPTIKTSYPPNIVCMADASAKAAIDENLCDTLHVGGDPSFVAIEASNGEDVVGALCARDYKGVGSQYVSEGKVIAQQSRSSYVVRKLMPIECERLQGFPDGWTDIEFKGKPASDAARYKALGNSMAVPVMLWIGERIERIDNEETTA